jgi:hypothetical protein
MGRAFAILFGLLCVTVQANPVLLARAYAVRGGGGESGPRIEGGSVYTNGNRIIHTVDYAASGTTLTVNEDTVVSFLIVAGGGGGGSGQSSPTRYGTGGGAGEVYYVTNYTLSAGSYVAWVGAGGAADSYGGDSSLSGGAILEHAKGGGKGAVPGYYAAVGAPGGSGGGARNSSFSSGDHCNWAGGASSRYNVTGGNKYSYGNAGKYGGWTCGGGGGGAGSSSTSYTGGNSVVIPMSPYGASRSYGAGGSNYNGQRNITDPWLGGSYATGWGDNNGSQYAVQGRDGTGSGGGAGSPGSGRTAGKRGGHGIVIVEYDSTQ